MTDKNIYQRLHEVMKAVSYVQKEDKKVNNQYTFVSHDAVTAKIRPFLLEHGVLSVPQNMRHSKDGNMTVIQMDIRFVNIDKPEDFLDVPSVGYGIDPQDKGVGKAISYAVKYALLKALSLETGDDPEKDNIDHKPEVKFTPEDKSLQAEIITKIGLCRDEQELQSLFDEYAEAFSQLPEVMQGIINDQVDNRMGQIKKGIQPPITSHKFAGVQDGKNWIAKMLPVIKGIKNIKMLEDWKERNSPFIAGLSDKGREYFLSEIDIVATKLTTQHPIG